MRGLSCRHGPCLNHPENAQPVGPTGARHLDQLVAGVAAGRANRGAGVYAVELPARRAACGGAAQPVSGHCAAADLVSRALSAHQRGADPHCGGHRLQLRPVAVRAGGAGAHPGAGADSALRRHVCGGALRHAGCAAHTQAAGRAAAQRR